MLLALGYNYADDAPNELPVIDSIADTDDTDPLVWARAAPTQAIGYDQAN